jgi:hypothetical protein
MANNVKRGILTVCPHPGQAGAPCGTPSTGKHLRVWVTLMSLLHDIEQVRGLCRESGLGHYAIAQAGKTSFAFKAAQLTYDIIYGPAYADILNHYNTIAGPTFMPPTRAFDRIWWRDERHADLRGAANAQEKVLTVAMTVTRRRRILSAINGVRYFLLSSEKPIAPEAQGENIPGCSCNYSDHILRSSVNCCPGSITIRSFECAAAAIATPERANDQGTLRGGAVRHDTKNYGIHTPT